MICRVERDCVAEAVYGVVDEVDTIDEGPDGTHVHVSMLRMTPACAMHVSAHAAEVRASATPDDFTVVHIMHAAGDPGRLS